MQPSNHVFTCKCKDLDPIGLLTGTKSYFREIVCLGTIGDLRRNLDCSFCQLCVQAMELNSHKDDDDDDDDERPDTAEVYCKHTTNTTYLFLFTSRGLGGIIDLYRQDAITAKSELAYPGGGSSLSDLHSNSGDRCAVWQGRVDATRIRSWIDCCIRDHGQYCCPPTMRKVRTSMGELPAYLACGTSRRILQLMLVDVLEERLVEHSVSETPEIPYIALSYVWGQTPMLQTTTDNLTKMRMPGAFSTNNVTLPRTVRDAMALVKDLGYRFLWVDILCIVQDAPNKRDQIQVMNLIYRRARLTIVAMVGENADSGLPGIMHGSHIGPPTAVIDGYKLQAGPPSFEFELKRSHHSTRGWTYQEVLLSPRCLFISLYQVYFRCTNGVSFQFTDSYSLNPITTLVWPTSARSEDAEILIEGYERYVEVYTRRQLTYDHDILNAFTAILQELSLIFSVTFHDAIPNMNIVRALLWCPTCETSPERRSSVTNPCADSTPYFPSWSWLGWKGPVTYYIANFGKLRNETCMCGLLPQASLFWKPAMSTAFQKIETSDTKTIEREEKEVRCGRYNCRTTLVGTGRTPHIKVEDTPHSSLAERRSPNGHLMGPGSPQLLPEKYANLSILQFRASTVMAQGYYFGECQYKSWMTDKCNEMDVLPIYDIQRRQCGGFFNPAIPTLTFDESQQFAIIALSVSPAVCLPYKELIDRSYGFMGIDEEKCMCILHVMLVRFHGEVAERVATGMMHPRAWKEVEPGPEYRLINLA